MLWKVNWSKSCFLGLVLVGETANFLRMIRACIFARIGPLAKPYFARFLGAFFRI